VRFGASQGPSRTSISAEIVLRGRRGTESLSMGTGFQCAGCGEWNETTVDKSAGRDQTYVEDCQVCCKPNVLHVEWDGQAQEAVITAELE
jgi:hypothetical protein